MIADLKYSQDTPSALKFYRGIVVDNNDPEKYGRVRVKLFGLNNHEAIDNLPWAEVMQPCGFGLISGVGLSAVLKQGTWVYVIFEDNNPERQIVIGVSTGINEMRSDGFTDPDNKYPLQTAIGLSDFGQCCINDFSLDNKGLTDTDMSSHGVMFNCQTSVSDEKYRDSWLLRTEKGILIELDDHDTRFKITHPEGTTVSVDSDGTVKVSSVKDIILNAKKDLEVNVLGDFKVNVDGSLKCDILKDFNMFCNQSLNWTVNQSVNWNVKNSVNYDIKNSMNFTAKESFNVKTANVSYRVSDTYHVSSVNVKFSASDSVKVNTGRITSNSSRGLIKGTNIITQQRVNLNTHRHKRSGSPRKPS